MIRKIAMAAALIMTVTALAACGAVTTEQAATADTAPEAGYTQEDLTAYGVFLGADPEDLERISGYRTTVIDAQYFTPEDIEYLHSNGCRVLSYLNVGSVENFRNYYKDYEEYTIGVYENWEDERWVDVSAGKWQEFILDELAPSILEKGVDGLFIDNCDVYYYSGRKKKIFDGLVTILKGLQSMDTYVCINGGDTFLTEYIEKYASPSDVADAVNQESVFSRIDWENDKFLPQTAEENQFFKEYIELAADNGMDVFVIEYTKDPDVARLSREYCKYHGFRCYVTDDLGLK